MQRTSSEGTSAMLGLLVGVSVFVVTFYVVVEYAIEAPSQTDQADRAGLQAEARVISSAIFENGRGWYEDGACDVDGKISSANFTPDKVGFVSGGVAIGRFGLAEETCKNVVAAPANLSFAKIQNLYNAAEAMDPDNGYVDYDEAHESLGLDAAGFEFHLRTWPVLPSVQQMLRQGYKDPYTQAVYLGDYVESTGVDKAVQHTAGVVDNLDYILLYVHITNNGTDPAIFGVQFDIALKSKPVDFTLHSRSLNVGESQNITYKIQKTADWKWEDDAARWVDYTISDVDGAFQSGTISTPMTMTHVLTRPLIVVESDTLYFEVKDGSATAKVHYSAYDGEGKAESFADWTYRLDTSLGLPISTVVLPNAQKGFATTPLTGVGYYTASVLNDLLLLTWNSDTVNIVTDEPVPFGGDSSHMPGPAAVEEIRFVDAVLRDFAANVFDADHTHVSVPYAAGGDVYPDIKSVMDNDLPAALTDASGVPTLSTYNTMIVGSDVDHNAMTSGAAKNTIRDWVYAGGTLIVFGSDAQNVQWLQPIFQSGLDSANGGLSTPDQQHPALRVPNTLDYEAFNYISEWGYNAGSDEYFTHVVSAGAEGDILGVSNAGSFGDGRVTLSSWRPYDLMAGQSDACPTDLATSTNCQPIFLVHNLITLSYRQLYLDYGPGLPTDENVSSYTRIASVYHPELEQVITVAVQVFAFKDG